MSRILAPLALCLAATTASAEIQVRFTESAPKDRFTITNASDCTLAASEVTFDLTGSAGALIFDTTATGAGVEVFQPFETTGDALRLAKAEVKDGETELTVTLAPLAPGAKASFTIDVDDTLKNSSLGQIRVAGSEMAGGTVILQTARQKATTQFNTKSRAALPNPACAS